MHPNRALLVEMVLLRSVFKVARLAHCVTVSPLHINLSPPTVSLTLWISDLLGRIIQSFFSVCDPAVFRNFGLINEEDSVGAVRSLGHSLC